MTYGDLVGPDTRSRTLGIMRIMIGLLYLESGTGKFLHFPLVTAYARIAAGSLPWWGGMFELVCGALIVLGLFTRPAAFLASGEMAVAYFVAHAPRGFFPLLNDGRPAVAFCFAFLHLAVVGGGAYTSSVISIDALVMSPFHPLVSRWALPPKMQL